MNYIKTYESFLIDEPSTMSELLEQLSVVEQNILDSIKAEPIDIFEFFNKELPTTDLEQLSKNGDFNKLLKTKGLMKANVEHTDDYETFLVSPFKYLLIKDKNKNELQDPDFILIQTFNSTEQNWNKIRLYKINGEFKNFYDKLSNRSIEINHDDKTYIYRTSTKNSFTLVNREENQEFPKNVRKEELLKMINKHAKKVN